MKNIKFLEKKIQEQYNKYLKKDDSFIMTDNVSFFVKLHNDFEWYSTQNYKNKHSINTVLIEDDLLYELPYLLFIYVSNADNDIDIDEYNSFLFILKKIAKNSSFSTYINKAIDVKTLNFQNIQKLNFTDSQIRNRLININNKLKLHNIDTRIKILFLINIISITVAQASGDIFNIKKINKHEERVIQDIKTIFNLDILEEDEFKTIGSSRKCNFTLSFKKNIDKEHIKVRLFNDFIVIYLLTDKFISKINNIELLNLNVPYVLSSEDILSIGDYVITYQELQFYIKNCNSNSVYEISNKELQEKYIIRFQNDSILVSYAGNSYFKIDYFEPLILENSILLYEQIVQKVNNSHLFFNNKILYIKLLNKNEIVKGSKHDYTFLIQKQSGIIYIETLVNIYRSGNIITNKDKLLVGEKLYFYDYKITIFEESITIKKLNSYDIELIDLNIRYQNDTILNNFNLSFENGEMTCIMGPSGCGKSTLLDAVSYPKSIKKATISGEILYNGMKLFGNYEKISNSIGFVSQEDVLYSNLTVFENLKFYMHINKIKYNRYLIENTLDSIGLLGKKDLKVGDKKERVLSGGQRKRLNIALEIIKSPKVLFLDEPTSGLSSKDSELIVKTLKAISQSGTTVISVLHQPNNKIFNQFDKFLFLMDGNVAYYGNTSNAYKYFSQFDEYKAEVCQTPDLFFDIAEAIETDTYGYEVRIENDGHLYEKKHKYSGKILNEKYMKYAKEMQ